MRTFAYLVCAILLAADGLHPNAQGYQVMKPLAEQAILAALKRKKRR